MALKRITKELADIQKNPIPNVKASPLEESNLFLWHAKILGPEGSSYEGGTF